MSMSMSMSEQSSSSLVEDQTHPNLPDQDETQDNILQLRGKLYIISNNNKDWEEKGEGVVEFLKHKDSGRVKLLFLHSLSLHVLANHPITGTMKLEEYAGKENSCMWNATDYEQGELKDQLFRIDFASAEDWEAFIRKFEEVTETQSKKEETEETTDPTAGFLDKLTASHAESKQETHV